METTNFETWKNNLQDDYHVKDGDNKFWNLEKQFTKLSCTGWVEDRDNKFWNLEKQFIKLSCIGWVENRNKQILKLGKTIYKIIMYKMNRELRQIWKLGKTTYKNFCGQKQTNVETWKNNLQNYHVHE